MLPSGVEEGVMLAVAPVVETERAAGRSGGTLSDEGTVEVGLEGKGGDEGDGLSKGVSLSSPSGVDAAESAMAGSVNECLWSNCWLPATAGSRKDSRGTYPETIDVVVIVKRANSNQVTVPPQSSADVDLAICGRLMRSSRRCWPHARVAVRCYQDCGGSKCQ